MDNELGICIWDLQQVSVINEWEGFPSSGDRWKPNNEFVFITKRQYSILKKLRYGHNYIARDQDGILCAYPFEPRKGEHKWVGQGDKIHKFYTNDFDFVKWEDKRAWDINVLIRNYNKKEKKYGI